MSRGLGKVQHCALAFLQAQADKSSLCGVRTARNLGALGWASFGDVVWSVWNDDNEYCTPTRAQHVSTLRALSRLVVLGLVERAVDQSEYTGKRRGRYKGFEFSREDKDEGFGDVRAVYFRAKCCVNRKDSIESTLTATYRGGAE